MVSKKGYLKTLEAVLAIVIILLFTFAVTPKPEPEAGVPYPVQSSQAFILSEITNDDSLRQLVIDSDESDQAYHDAYIALDAIIQDNVPSGYSYTFGICGTSACVSNISAIAIDRSVYAKDRLIASGGGVQDPKVIRLWMWRK